MSNPVLSEDRWSKLRHLDGVSTTSTVMTVEGTMNKTLILLAILLGTVGLMWGQFWHGALAIEPARLMPWMIGGAIGGLILVIVSMFAPRSVPVIAPLYAVAEGLFIGGLTMLYNAQWKGLPLLAAVITLGITLGVVLLCRFGIVRASNGFVRGVMGATVGVCLALGILWLLSFFGIGGNIIGTLRGNGMIGIGFSVFMIILATFNLVVDMRIIEDGAQARAPKWMEWMGAFGLLVTIVWLYIEVLRLMSKFQKRN